MARGRLPAKRDGNHDELARLFGQLGCSVFEAHATGDGFTDLVVGCMGITLLVEIKTDAGTLTPVQEVFHRDWRGQLAVVRTREDVIRLVTETRARAGRRDRATDMLREVIGRVRRGLPVPKELIDDALAVINL